MPKCSDCIYEGDYKEFHGAYMKCTKIFPINPISVAEANRDMPCPYFENKSLKQSINNLGIQENNNYLSDLSYLFEYDKYIIQDNDEKDFKKIWDHIKSNKDVVKRQILFDNLVKFCVGNIPTPLGYINSPRIYDSDKYNIYTIVWDITNIDIINKNKIKNCGIGLKFYPTDLCPIIALIGFIDDSTVNLDGSPDPLYSEFNFYLQCYTSLVLLYELLLAVNVRIEVYNNGKIIYLSQIQINEINNKLLNIEAKAWWSSIKDYEEQIKKIKDLDSFSKHIRICLEQIGIHFKAGGNPIHFNDEKANKIIQRRKDYILNLKDI